MRRDAAAAAGCDITGTGINILQGGQAYRARPRLDRPKSRARISGFQSDAARHGLRGNPAAGGPERAGPDRNIIARPQGHRPRRCLHRTGFIQDNAARSRCDGLINKIISRLQCDRPRGRVKNLRFRAQDDIPPRLQPHLAARHTRAGAQIPERARFEGDVLGRLQSNQGEVFVQESGVHIQEKSAGAAVVGHRAGIGHPARAGISQGDIDRINQKHSTEPAGLRAGIHARIQ